MDGWDEFDRAVCGWVLRELPADELIDAAVAALAAGCDSPWMVRLAVMDGGTWSEFPPVVAAVYDERGLAAPTAGSAVKTLADRWLAQLVSGELDVRIGVDRLYRLAIGNLNEPATDDLGVFIGLAEAFYLADEGHMGTPEEVTADALSRARVLLDSGGVSVDGRRLR